MSGRQTDPSRGTIATIIVFRPPNCARICLSIWTNGWRAGRLASTLKSARSRPMPTIRAAVTAATTISTGHARRTRKRAQRSPNDMSRFLSPAREDIASTRCAHVPPSVRSAPRVRPDVPPRASLLPLPGDGELRVLLAGVRPLLPGPGRADGRDDPLAPVLGAVRPRCARPAVRRARRSHLAPLLPAGERARLRPRGDDVAAP